MVTTESEQMAYIAAQAADARVNVEVETDEHDTKFDPQHPATHGTLRIVADLMEKSCRCRRIWAICIVGMKNLQRCVPTLR